MGVRRPVLLWLPLAAFLAVLALVAWNIYRPADRTVWSAMVGQPVPSFALKPMVVGKPGVDSRGDALAGQPRLLNVFASWCVPCAAEAPQLLRLKAMGVPVEAIAVRDTPAAVQAFLARYGDPYAAVGDDRNGRAQLMLGSSGVPESFVVDGRGQIVTQHVGDIRAEDVDAIAAAVRGAR